ncbi:ROK family transcriptional regulator [uncultured Ilyobacter sp.]|jgi:N-acetylglucosamine repressor|uniref:ROK family transcriptional regulator n=1 Tax=uncultured Ilyobacter sp. TaxID=544433 RepID=UPI002AA7EDB9|nr:ROK family transcriptional regulator [uncultured Ilyobacter sp.]
MDKNSLVALEIIRKHKHASRRDLTREMGLTPAAITKITKKLIEKGYLKEVGRGKTTGGRPPIILELNSHKGYIIGMYYAPSDVSLILMNLHSEVVYSSKIHLTKKSKEAILKESFELVEKAIEHCEGVKILGIGVALNGLVDYENGISIFSPHYKWRDFPIKEEMEKKFKIPTVVDNDVRMMALAEREYGGAKDCDNFIMLNVGDGIGAGIVINGEVFRGSTFSAGEIGHIKVNEKGENFCSCGKKGCLEAEISTKSIMDKIKRELSEDREKSILSEKIESGIVFGDVCESAMRGDFYCLELLRYIGNTLAKGLSNVINVINPKLFIINGEINKCSEIVFPIIKLGIQKYSMYTSAKDVEFKSSYFDDGGASLGAAAMVFRNVFTYN